MDLNRKERIIGIVVVTILIIVLVPLLFSSSQKAAEQPTLSAAIPAAPNKPLIKKAPAQKTAQAWVVQLGTFANKANVDGLIKKLQNKGFAAYSKKQKSANEYIYQVLVGPEIDREKAKELLHNLQNTFKLKGIIVRYEP